MQGIDTSVRGVYRRFYEFLGTFSTPCLDTRDPQCVDLLN